MAKPFTSILNNARQRRGLPIVKNFTVPQGSTDQLLVVSGTAFSDKSEKQLTVEVLVEANVVGKMEIWSDEEDVHRAFPSVLIPLRLTPGSNHTLTLRELDHSDTKTDANDRFSAAVVF